MSEAALRMGISVDTVRRRLRKGELQGRHQPTPQGFIWLVELPDPSTTLEAGDDPTPYVRADATSQAHDAGARHFTGHQSESGNTPALRELVDVLRHEIDTRDRQLESKDRQIEQLHSLLQQAQSGTLSLGEVTT